MMMDVSERNDSMMKRSDGGASYSQIAREFGLSSNRTRQIILRERRRRSETRNPDRMGTALKGTLMSGLDDKYGLRLSWITSCTSDAQVIDALRERGLLDDGGESLLEWYNFGKKKLEQLREFIGWVPEPVDPPAEISLIDAINEATSIAMAENNPGEDWDRYERATAIAAAEATLKWCADRAKSKVARGVFENALAEVISLNYDPIWPTTADATRSIWRES